jgi:ornithine cyclodeaminase/alanine dehydrogenase-like protein (mu-crystallin family)
MTRCPPALILTRADVARLMSPSDTLATVEAGFRALAEGRAVSPPPLHIGAEGGAFHGKGASLIGSRHYVALKFNGNFPGNPQRMGLPTIQGAILLCDGRDGSLLAILDSQEITLRRTAAASALAARLLARPDSNTLAVCGCGAQGRAHVQALAQVFALRDVFLWDLDVDRAAALASELGGAAYAMHSVRDMRDATAAADIIATCTTACTPFLGPDDVRPGTFVAAVGADSPAKNEIEPALLARATVVADVLAQCESMGDLRHAIAAGAMVCADVHAELADVVAERKPRRRSREEIFVFDSTGTAIEDVASAAYVYERARERGVGLAVSLGDAMSPA